ncbi:hypothetical protein JTB14_034774 [Gonioctena quinquepunctata]|nr:hypothetical protein JTB14_034774 [Gonioctena quinquepunctata]
MSYHLNYICLDISIAVLESDYNNITHVVTKEYPLNAACKQHDIANSRDTSLKADRVLEGRACFEGGKKGRSTSGRTEGNTTAECYSFPIKVRRFSTTDPPICWTFSLGYVGRGAGAVAKTVIDAKNAKKKLSEDQRHNEAMVHLGSSLYLRKDVVSIRKNKKTSIEAAQ